MGSQPAFARNPCWKPIHPPPHLPFFPHVLLDSATRAHKMKLREPRKPQSGARFFVDEDEPYSVGWHYLDEVLDVWSYR